jgi:hypothetical protein
MKAETLPEEKTDNVFLEENWYGKQYESFHSHGLSIQDDNNLVAGKSILMELNLSRECSLEAQESEREGWKGDGSKSCSPIP